MSLSVLASQLLAKLRGARKSLTVWVNGVMLILLPIFEQINNALPQLQQYLPDSIYKWAGLILVVLNIVIRFRTTTALENK